MNDVIGRIKADPPDPLGTRGGRTYTTDVVHSRPTSLDVAEMQHMKSMLSGIMGSQLPSAVLFCLNIS